MWASVADLAVLFVLLQFPGVERSWSLLVSHVVVEPLSRISIAERVPKEFLFVVVGAGGSAPAAVRGGRAVSRECRIFDCTKGYQGEDVLP